jgi:hypothetical protein
MSFINANTANPTSTSLGYSYPYPINNTTNIPSGQTDLFTPSNTLTQGVWLINACAYFQSGNVINNATLNIVYNTSPITLLNFLSSTYMPESAVIYFSGSVGLQQVALNTMTVLYVGSTPCYYGAVVSATTINGGTWNILNSGNELSIIRATKIA